MTPFEGKPVTVLSREMEVLTAFARELTKHRIFIQSFHPTLFNWLPFYWNGFRQTTHFTNIFHDLTNLDKVWYQMKGGVRTNIRKAEKGGLSIVSCNGDLVATMAEKSFGHQGQSLPYSRAYIARLCRAARQQGGGECFAAVDNEGKTHAAMFLVWDRRQAYYLAGGADPQLRASGAQSLLLWHLIKFASSRAEVFDFEGSVIEHVEKFFSGFGAKLVPYNRILKLPRAMWAGLALMGMYK